MRRNCRSVPVGLLARRTNQSVRSLALSRIALALDGRQCSRKQGRPSDNLDRNIRRSDAQRGGRRKLCHPTGRQRRSPSRLGSAAWAGFVSYLGGTVCMLVLAVVLREAVPTMADIHRSHWWAWTGGFFGAVYIAISIFLVPRLGAAFFIALLVTGADGSVCRVRSFRLRLAYRSTRSTFLGSSGRYCW